MEVKLIEEKWKLYAANVIPPGLRGDEEAMALLKHTFMVGAVTTLGFMTLNPEDTLEGLEQRVEKVSRELGEFIDKVNRLVEIIRAKRESGGMMVKGTETVQ
jgi:hypothetical protein